MCTVCISSQTLPTTFLLKWCQSFFFESLCPGRPLFVAVLNWERHVKQTNPTCSVLFTIQIGSVVETFLVRKVSNSAVQYQFRIYRVSLTCSITFIGLRSQAVPTEGSSLSIAQKLSCSLDINGQAQTSKHLHKPKSNRSSTI